MKALKAALLGIVLVLAAHAGPAFAAAYENVVWRFAERHEAGDLEPSEFVYLATNGKNVLVHSASPGDPESVDVYRVTGKTAGGFSASLAETYILENGRMDREDLGSSPRIRCSVSGSALTYKSATSQLKMRRTDARMDRAFPAILVRRYLSR